MAGINIVDGVLVGIIGISTIISLFRGFIKEAFSLASWGIAAYLSFTMYEPLSLRIGESIGSDMVRNGLAFGGVFTGTLIAGSIVNYLIGFLVKSSGLGSTDKLLGMIFGAARGILLDSLLVLAVSYTPFSDNPYWTSSSVVPQFDPVVLWLKSSIPTQLNVVKKYMDQPEHKNVHIKKPDLNMVLLKSEELKKLESAFTEPVGDN